jgi:hypothetical protein
MPVANRGGDSATAMGTTRRAAVMSNSTGVTVTLMPIG